MERFVSHITLRQLAVFSEVLKHSSTSKAAQTLALSQSAVSASLLDLERQLGIQLFNRVGKKLLVNEHGRLLYPRAMALLEQAREIEQLFDAGQGHIRLAASSTIGNYLLPEKMAAFQQNQSGTRIELQIGNSQQVIEAVSQFSADVGLIEGACYHPNIVSIPWSEDELVLFAARADIRYQQPVSLQTLADSAWIVREPNSGTRQRVNQDVLSKLPHFTLAYELGNSEAVKQAVRHGLGISCLSRLVIADLLLTGELQTIISPLQAIKRSLYLIHHQQKPLSKVIQQFLHFC